jgi:hypothetical protein
MLNRFSALEYALFVGTLCITGSLLIGCANGVFTEAVQYVGQTIAQAVTVAHSNSLPPLPR